MEIKAGLIHSFTEHVPSVNTALDPGNRAVHNGVGAVGGDALLVQPQMGALWIASPNSARTALLLMFFLNWNQSCQGELVPEDPGR